MLLKCKSNWWFLCSIYSTHVLFLLEYIYTRCNTRHFYAGTKNQVKIIFIRKSLGETIGSKKMWKKNTLLITTIFKNENCAIFPFIFLTISLEAVQFF